MQKTESAHRHIAIDFENNEAKHTTCKHTVSIASNVLLLPCRRILLHYSLLFFFFFLLLLYLFWSFKWELRAPVQLIQRIAFSTYISKYIKDNSLFLNHTSIDIQSTVEYSLYVWLYACMREKETVENWYIFLSCNQNVLTWFFFSLYFRAAKDHVTEIGAIKWNEHFR